MSTKSSRLELFPHSHGDNISATTINHPEDVAMGYDAFSTRKHQDPSQSGRNVLKSGFSMAALESIASTTKIYAPSVINSAPSVSQDELSKSTRIELPQFNYNSAYPSRVITSSHSSKDLSIGGPVRHFGSTSQSIMRKESGLSSTTANMSSSSFDPFVLKSAHMEFSSHGSGHKESDSGMKTSHFRPIVKNDSFENSVMFPSQPAPQPQAPLSLSSKNSNVSLANSNQLSTESLSNQPHISQRTSTFPANNIFSVSTSESRKSVLPDSSVKSLKAANYSSQGASGITSGEEDRAVHSNLLSISQLTNPVRGTEKNESRFYQSSLESSSSSVKALSSGVSAPSLNHSSSGLNNSNASNASGFRLPTLNQSGVSSTFTPYLKPKILPRTKEGHQSIATPHPEHDNVYVSQYKVSKANLDTLRGSSSSASSNDIPPVVDVSASSGTSKPTGADSTPSIVSDSVDSKLKPEDAQKSNETVTRVGDTLAQSLTSLEASSSSALAPSLESEVSPMHASVSLNVPTAVLTKDSSELSTIDSERSMIVTPLPLPSVQSEGKSDAFEVTDVTDRATNASNSLSNVSSNNIPSEHRIFDRKNDSQAAPSLISKKTKARVPDSLLQQLRESIALTDELLSDSNSNSNGVFLASGNSERDSRSTESSELSKSRAMDSTQSQSTVSNSQSYFFNDIGSTTDDHSVGGLSGVKETPRTDALISSFKKSRSFVNPPSSKRKAGQLEDDDFLPSVDRTTFMTPSTRSGSASSTRWGSVSGVDPARRSSSLKERVRGKYNSQSYLNLDSLDIAQPVPDVKLSSFSKEVLDVDAEEVVPSQQPQPNRSVRSNAGKDSKTQNLFTSMVMEAAKSRLRESSSLQNVNLSNFSDSQVSSSKPRSRSTSRNRMRALARERAMENASDIISRKSSVNEKKVSYNLVRSPLENSKIYYPNSNDSSVFEGRSGSTVGYNAQKAVEEQGDSLSINDLIPQDNYNFGPTSNANLNKTDQGSILGVETEKDLDLGTAVATQEMEYVALLSDRLSRLIYPQKAPSTEFKPISSTTGPNRDHLSARATMNDMPSSSLPARQPLVRMNSNEKLAEDLESMISRGADISDISNFLEADITSSSSESKDLLKLRNLNKSSPKNFQSDNIVSATAELEKQLQVLNLNSIVLLKMLEVHNASTNEAIALGKSLASSNSLLSRINTPNKPSLPIASQETSPSPSIPAKSSADSLEKKFGGNYPRFSEKVETPKKEPVKFTTLLKQSAPGRENSPQLLNLSKSESILTDLGVQFAQKISARRSESLLRTQSHEKLNLLSHPLRDYAPATASSLVSFETGVRSRSSSVGSDGFRFRTRTPDSLGGASEKLLSRGRSGGRSADLNGSTQGKTSFSVLLKDQPLDKLSSSRRISIWYDDTRDLINRYIGEANKDPSSSYNATTGKFSGLVMASNNNKF